MEKAWGALCGSWVMSLLKGGCSSFKGFKGAIHHLRGLFVVYGRGLFIVQGRGPFIVQGRGPFVEGGGHSLFEGSREEAIHHSREGIVCVI